MKHRRTIFFTISLVVCLVTAGLIALFSYFISQRSKFESDQLTSQNLVLISSKIKQFYILGNKLPDSLKEISIRNKVKYTKQSDRVYTLCGEYKKETRPLINEYDAHNALNEIGAINYHKKGTDCFTVSMD